MVNAPSRLRHAERFARVRRQFIAYDSAFIMSQ